jgi:hypothetical protein
MKTTIHTYYFDCADAAQNLAYKQLCEQLKAQGLSVFCTWGGGKGHYQSVNKIDGLAIELETTHLFNNQWNTAPIEGHSDKGLRVFDWAEDYPINFRASIKRGHYLTQTPEMSEIRRNTCGCGYCGKQEPAAKGYTFCPHCLDSAYLKIEDLKLLRMVSVADSAKTRPALTEAEKAHLVPLYKNAQMHGNTERGKARIQKERADLLKERDSAIEKANTKFTGFTWLMDHGVNTENVIYYDHVKTFSFGWRTPLSNEIVSDLLEIISEFPFQYELKCADGRKLKN